LQELTFVGRQAIDLPSGETRRFLEDGDEIIFRARAERPGFASIGFGECRDGAAGAVVRLSPPRPPGRI
jgi:fumarylacetoacetase